MAEQRVATGRTARIARWLGIGALQGGEVLLHLAALIVLGRSVGAEVVGRYAYATDCAAISVLFAVFGFDLAAVRFVAEAAAKQDWRRARAFLRFSTWVVLAASVTAAAAMFGIAVSLSGDAGGAMIATLALAAAAAPFQALTLANAGALRGFGRSVTPRAFRTAPPAAVLLVAVVTSRLGVSGPAIAPTLLSVSLAASVVIWLTSHVMVRRALPREANMSAAANVASLAGQRWQWLRAGACLVLISGIMLVQTRIDTVLITRFLGEVQAGAYAVAVRLSMVLALALTATNYLIAPRCASLFATGRLGEMQAVVRRATRLSLATTVPLAAMLILGGRPLLAWVGPEFATAYTPMLVLMFAYLMWAVSGPVGVVATMTGNELLLACVQGSCVALNFGLGLVAIPRWGLLGAAVTTATVTAIARCAMAIAVARRVGVSTLPFGSLPALPPNPDQSADLPAASQAA